MSDVQSLPNPLDDIVAFLEKDWPELFDIPGVWLSGGHVWRRLLGHPVAEAKDVDLFCTNAVAMARVEQLLAGLSACTCEGLTCNCLGSGGAPSVGPLGGEVWFTRRGRVDLWSCQSVKKALRAYSDIKEHARVAFNVRGRHLMWLPSKVERKKGEKYIHFEPEVKEEWLTRKPIMEWREWPGEGLLGVQT